MKVKLSLLQDGDAHSCNWHEIAKIVQEWSMRHTEKEASLVTPVKGAAELSLDYTGDDLTFSIQELHGQLYDHQVNFTVLVSE